MFFLIPILTGIGGWLATAGLGTILTAGFGVTLFAWLTAHLIIPLLIVLGLFGIGCLMLFYGLKEPKLGWKHAGGALMIGLAILAFFKFFMGFILIPGVFSVAGAPTTLSLADSLTTQSGVFELAPPLNYAVIVIVAYAMYVALNKKNRR